MCAIIRADEYVRRLSSALLSVRRAGLFVQLEVL